MKKIRMEPNSRSSGTPTTIRKQEETEGERNEENHPSFSLSLFFFSFHFNTLLKLEYHVTREMNYTSV